MMTSLGLKHSEHTASAVDFSCDKKMSFVIVQEKKYNLKSEICEKMKEMEDY